MLRLGRAFYDWIARGPESPARGWPEKAPTPASRPFGGRDDFGDWVGDVMVEVDKRREES